jgi:hypothetical protein
MKFFFICFILLTFSFAALSQANNKTFPLVAIVGLKPVHVTIKAETYQGKKSVAVIDTAKGITSELKYAKLTDFRFHNGTIQVELAGQPLATAVETARGFVGIAFRIDETDTKFECLYLRQPTVGLMTRFAETTLSNIFLIRITLGKGSVRKHPKSMNLMLILKWASGQKLRL